VDDLTDQHAPLTVRNSWLLNPEDVVTEITVRKRRVGRTHVVGALLRERAKPFIEVLYLVAGASDLPERTQESALAIKESDVLVVVDGHPAHPPLPARYPQTTTPRLPGRRWWRDTR